MVYKRRVCVDCFRLMKARKHIVGYDGDPNPQIIFLGQNPGAKEDSFGKPFIGMCGKFLKETIRRRDMRDYRIGYYNVVLCHSPNNSAPTLEEIENCFHNWENLLEEKKPDVIVTLGETARFAVLGVKGGITKESGKLHHTPYGKVITIVHPSFAKRSLKGLKIWNDSFDKMEEILWSYIVKGIKN